MRKVLVASLLLLALAPTAALAEDFKGKDDPAKFGFGALMGMGVLDHRAGFTLLGTAAMKIIDRGFVPDITNSVWIETELGPLWVGGSSSLTYSAHLRWDFNQNEQWTLYAIGGVGGNITSEALGDRFELFPRFGMGAIWRVAQNFGLRGEISHELIGIGLLFPI